MGIYDIIIKSDRSIDCVFLLVCFFVFFTVNSTRTCEYSIRRPVDMTDD